MRTLRNRYNDGFIRSVLGAINPNRDTSKHWEVSLEDKDGQFHDHFFVAKPTRKQIRKLHKVRKHYLSSKCYECGKRIELGKEFTLDDLNYAHADCLKG